MTFLGPWIGSLTSSARLNCSLSRNVRNVRKPDRKGGCSTGMRKPDRQGRAVGSKAETRAERGCDMIICAPSLTVGFPHSRASLTVFAAHCLLLAAYCLLSVAVLVGGNRCMFTELLHRREQLLAIAVRREVDTLALRDSPARALDEIRLFWHTVAKARSRPAGIQTCAHEERSEERRVGKECRSRWSP